jgi:uncharacterized damage-inducible protein DinB
MTSAHDLTALFHRLGKARSALFAAADQVSTSRWRQRPGATRWSAAEVIAHLTQVEDAITSNSVKLVEREPRRFPVWRRWRAPFWVIEYRLARRESPLPLDPSILAGKEEMLAALRESRRRTLAFLEETSARDLSAYAWPHPFLGTFGFYEWFRLIAHHEIRHTKQIREIVNSFHELSDF